MTLLRYSRGEADAMRRLLDVLFQPHPWDLRWVDMFEPEAYERWVMADRARLIEDSSEVEGYE